MNRHVVTDSYRPSTYTRRRFVQVAAVAGAGAATGAAVAYHPLLSALTATPASAAGCGESVQDMLNLAYTIERAATTFYYTGLTSKALLRSPQLAGSSADPNAVARNGNRANCANLQAALDQEQKHAQLLANAGAVSSIGRFHFPAAAFQHLGYTSHAGTFLWTLDHLETACIAIYLAAVKRFAALGRPDLAVLCARNLAVESEHRALYRVISQDDPANNITVPVTEFTCVSDALSLFNPYLSGHGFPRGVAVTHAIVFPTPVQTARVIGKNTST